MISSASRSSRGSYCTTAILNNATTVISPKRTHVLTSDNITTSSVVVDPLMHPASENTKLLSPTGALATSTGLPNVTSTEQPGPRLSPFSPELTSFGIFLVAFGGVLVAFIIIALFWICCRGREKSPQAPHSQVKLKPWSRTKGHSVDDMTAEESDHPKSYQNQGSNRKLSSSNSTEAECVASENSSKTEY